MKFVRTFCLWLIAFGFIYSCDTYSHVNPKEINVSKKEFTSTSFSLPKELDEISGLQIDKDYFYGFNDSGGKAALYKITPKGNISQTIFLKNAKNVDWESIASNDSLIFLCDVGNNRGNRKDLCIYYLRKDAISPNKEIQHLEANKIAFHYPEQTNFEKQNYQHDFDCEAVCWFNGKLHLFTKEWKSKRTHHYTLELGKKEQAAKLIDSYNSNFLITGADILQLDAQNSLLALIGYSKLGAIHLVRTKVPNKSDKLLSFTKDKIHLGRSGKLGQVEGIAIESSNTLYYSAEAYKKVPQHITKLRFK